MPNNKDDSRGGANRGGPYNVKRDKKGKSKADILAELVNGPAFEDSPGLGALFGDNSSLPNKLKKHLDKSGTSKRKQAERAAVEFIPPAAGDVNRERGAHPFVMPEKNRTAPNVAQSETDGLMDYLDNFLAEKMADLETGAGFDYETALRDSTRDIRKAYANDIKAIRGSNKAARKETSKNRKGIEEMYNALAASFAQDADQSIVDGESLAAKMQAISAGAADTVSKSASQIAQEQSAMAEGLGIQAAMPNIMGQQANNQIQAIGDITESGANAANDQMQFAGNNQRFMDRTAQGTKLEGASRSADLLGSLQDFIQGNRSQIAGLKGQRHRDIATNRTTVLNDVATRKEDASNNLFDQLLQLGGFKLDTEDTQADNDLAAQTQRDRVRQAKAKARADAAKTAAQLALEQQKIGASGGGNSPIPEHLRNYNSFISTLPEDIQAIANQITQSPEFSAGSFHVKNGGDVKMNSTSAGNLAVQKARESGIKDPQTLESIRLAAQIYFEGGV